MNDFVAEQSRAWCEFAQQCKVVPSPRPNVKGAETAFLFRIIKFESLPIPKALFDKSDKPKDSVKLHLSATLFDTKAHDSGSFVGNTWIGEKKTLQECCTGRTTGFKDIKWNKRDSVVRDVDFGNDYGFVFYTSQNTSDLRVVVECVVTIFEDNSPLEEYGICWCSFHIDPSEKDPKNPVAAKLDAVYFGTPRFLLFKDENHTQLKKAKIEHASASFLSMKYDTLKLTALHLMVENELCGGGDRKYGAIPGLISTTPGIRVDRGFVSLNSDLSALEEFELSLDKTCFQLPSNFERLFTEYLARISAGIPNAKIEYQMDVGVHNGRRFLENQMIELEKTAGNACKAGRITVRRCMADQLVSIIILLKAQVKSKDIVSNICLGWIPIVPWRHDELVLGTYSVQLLNSAPFISVSRLLTFQQDGSMEPFVVTTTLQHERPKSSIDIGEVIQKSSLAGHAPKTMVSEISTNSEQAVGHVGRADEHDDMNKSMESTSESDASEIECVSVETPLVVRRKRIDRIDVRDGSGISSVLPENDSLKVSRSNDVTRESLDLRCETQSNEISMFPSAGSTSTPGSPLQKIRLKCYTASNVSEVDLVSIGSSWKEVQANLQDHLGFFANLIFDDNNGDEVTVDGDVGWKALVKLLQDDWENDRQLNGEIEVDLVPVETLSTGEIAESDVQRPPPQPSTVVIAAIPHDIQPPQQAMLSQQPLAHAELEKVRESATELHKANEAVQTSEKSANTDPLSPRRLIANSSRSDRHRDDVRGKSESDPSISDENIPPSNRIARISRPKEIKRGGGSARAILSTDSSDIDENHQKADASRGRRRRAREYQVQEVEVIPEKESDSHIVPGRPDPPSALSRVLKAKLFTSTISALIQYHRADVPFRDWSDSLNSAVGDTNQVGGCEDIVVQLLAAKIPESFSHVYFTFNFYHFPPVKTPVAVLERIPSQDLQGLDAGNCPAILRVIDGLEQGSSIPGIAVHFVVDSNQVSASKPKTTPDFFRYLSSRILCIEMWDADSKLPIGTARVDLRVLLRHGTEAIQTGGEFPLSQMEGPSANEESVSKTQLSLSTLEPSIYVRLISVLRHPADNFSEFIPSSESITCSVDPAQKSDLSISKGLALLFVYKDIVLGLLKDVSGVAPATRLQDAIICARLELTSKEVTELVLYLTNKSAGRAADINQIRIGGQEVLDKCSDRRDELLASIRSLQRTIAIRYSGDISKTFEDNSSNGVMSLQHVTSMLQEHNQDLASALMTIAGADVGSGLTLHQFCSFFCVEYNPNFSNVPPHIDKKLARWQRLQAKRQTQTGTLTQYDGHDKQLFLEAAKRMREVHKESQIKQFLQKCITTRETIYPSFGQVCYVPYLLCSPFSEVRVIAIHIDNPELALVTDVGEWRELERHSTRSLGVVEDDLFSRDGQDYTVCLQPHQKVVVPFKLRITSSEHMMLDTEEWRGHVSALVGQVTAPGPASKRQRILSVTFSACAADGHRGPPLYVLEVDVVPRPFVIDHTFRLYHGKNDFMKRKIILDTSSDLDGCSWRGGPPRVGPSWQRNQKHLWCSNPAVVIGSSAASSDSDKQEIHVKYRCGEAGHEDSFYLLLYNDAWHVALYEIWHVHVLALNRLDVEGLVGQTESTAVMVRCRDGPRPVCAFSSAPEVVSFPEPNRTIDAGLSEFPLDFHPLAPGRRDVLVHIMPASQQGHHRAALGSKPVSAWLLATNARMPLVARRYDIRLPLGRVCNKKILYSNPYGFATASPTNPFSHYPGARSVGSLLCLSKLVNKPHQIKPSNVH